MLDFLYSGILTDHKVAFGYALTTQLANEAVLAHDCDPVAAHILTRALTTGVLYTPQLREGERLNIVWHYHGAMKSVIVDAGTDGTVRGLVSPSHLAHIEAEGNRVDLFGAEPGYVNVIRTGRGEILSSSTGEAGFLDVVEDFTFTLSVSDQVETGASILVGFQPDVDHPVRICQGVLIQAMPDADLLKFDEFRQRLARTEFRELIATDTEIDNYFEHVLRELTGEDKPAYRIEEKPNPVWRCNCNRDKMTAVLQTLPPDDREDIIAKGEPLKIRCEFCNKLFEVTVEECQSVWNAESA